MQNSDQLSPFGVAPASAPFGGLSPEVIQTRVREGWRCVRFEFCVSFLLATVRRQSGVYLTETWQDRYLRGLGYSGLALLLGPWGIPWGVLGTLRATWTNLTGGVDVTDEVLARLGEDTAPDLNPLTQS